MDIPNAIYAYGIFIAGHKKKLSDSFVNIHIQVKSWRWPEKEVSDKLLLLHRNIAKNMSTKWLLIIDFAK